MEDYFNLFCKWKATYFFFKWKTTSAAIEYLSLPKRSQRIKYMYNGNMKLYFLSYKTMCKISKSQENPFGEKSM